MKRFASFDGIRGVAILTVLAGHIAANYPGLTPDVHRLVAGFLNPDLGVRVFFVLSGFLITHLLLNEQATTGRINLREFYWRRGLRIYPAFYTYLAVIGIAALWFPVGVTLPTWIAAATFSWNYSPLWVTPPPGGSWNLGHFWTLALEQQFYLLWPFLLTRLGARRALLVAVGVVLWSPVARVGTYFLFPGQRGLVEMMAHTGMDSLMAGSAMAIVMAKARWREWVAGVDGRWLILGAAWLLVVSPALTLAVRGFNVVAGFTLDAAVCTWLVAWVQAQPESRLSRALAWPGLVFLGVISYSLYLWQQWFLHPRGWVGDGLWYLAVLGALAVAVFSHYLIERPALRLKRRHETLPASTP